MENKILNKADNETKTIRKADISQEKILTAKSPNKPTLNETQLISISKYSMDLSRLLFASAIVGFFIPGHSGKVSFATYIVGLVFSSLLFIGGVILLKSIKSSNL